MQSSILRTGIKHVIVFMGVFSSYIEKGWKRTLAEFGEKANWNFKKAKEDGERANGNFEKAKEGGERANGYFKKAKEDEKPGTAP